MELENNNSSTVETESTGTEQVTENQEKTYTEAEVQAMLQREGDKRVSGARKKWQAELDTKLAEAEKLRNMDETQRKEYEYEQKVKEFEEKERQFNLTQNKVEAAKVLSNRGLPVEFVDYIVAEDAETMMENINTFETAFKAAVADAVSKKIASPTPKDSSVKQTGLTQEEFLKMNTAQRAELYRTNPTLYKQLKTQN